MLLVSWICEHELIDHYQPRLDEMARALSLSESRIDRLNVDGLRMALGRFETEYRQMELQKRLIERPYGPRARDQENDLRFLEQKQSNFIEEAQQQAENIAQELPRIVPTLSPDKAAEFVARWKAMISAKSAGMKLSAALRGPLAGQYNKWEQDLVDEGVREESETVARIAQFKRAFIWLYIVGSILVVIGEYLGKEEVRIENKKKAAKRNIHVKEEKLRLQP